MAKSFDLERDIPDLSGKVIVLTGGNSGLGEDTIRRLAVRTPKHIYATSRSIPKIQAVISSIEQKVPDVQITPIQLDTSSFASIKAAATKILELADRIDLLYLNSGVSGPAPALTEEGYEYQFGVNYLGHALLVQLLLPLLLKTAESQSPKSDVRIISITSLAAWDLAPKEGLLLDQAKTTMPSHHGMARYGHSKLAMILHTRKMAQSYPRLTFVAIHPGFLDTGAYKKAQDAPWWFMIMWKLGEMFAAQKVEEGTKAYLWAGLADDVESGGLYVPIGLPHDGGKHGKDQNMMDELKTWTDRELAPYT